MKTAERNLAPTGIGIPRDLKAYLERQAKSQFRSLSGEIVRRLDESRRRDETADGMGAQTQGAAQ